MLMLTASPAASAENLEVQITYGTETQRGFLNDNVYYSDLGDIHYSSYIPESYDGSEAYALFVTLPGWEGLYFHGVGVNMVEDFGPEAKNYNEKMIIVSPQLNDWGETSARQTIALTEFLIENYNIDAERVYLEGYSGGGETGSLVMGMRPELYAAFLMVSSKWDGDMETLTASKTPVYLVTGERDSYYGSGPMKNAYVQLRDLYVRQGISDAEIDELLVLDVKEQGYFTERGYTDQHAGGMAIAKDEKIMSWLFKQRKQNTTTPKAGDFPQELESIPAAYLKPAEVQGRLVDLWYDTWNAKTYEQKTDPIRKKAAVYLPYGYSEDRQYNVYYWMHGGWGDETTQLGSEGEPNTFKNVVDHLIEEGRIEPLIIVCPTYNNETGHDSWDYTLAYYTLTVNYHNELVNDLIPAVEGTFSTYAKSINPEDIAASRDHRAFAGFSMGSVCTLYTLENCLDQFRYFQPMSGSIDPVGIDAAVTASGYKPEDFFLLTITGTEDFAGQGFASLVKYLLRMPSGNFVLADNETEGNVVFRLKQGYAHDEQAVREYVYNGLLWFWNHN